MRKIFTLTVALLLCFVFFAIAKAAPIKPNVIINVDTTSIAVGETVHVSWKVTGNYNLGPYGGIYGYWLASYDDYVPDPIPTTGNASFTPEKTGTIKFVVLIDWDDEIYDSYVEYTSKVITVSKSPVRTVSSPSGVKAKSADYNKIKLDWNSVSGASGYQIYRATSKSGTYKIVATINGGTKKTYTDPGLTTGKTYFYKIRAYIKVGSTYICGNYSSILSNKPIPSSPAGVVAESAGNNKIRLKWNAVSGVSGYKLYRSTSQKGTYKYIDAVTSTSFLDTGLNEGKVYYYKILAYKKLKNETYSSAYSQYKAAMPLSIPAIAKVESKSNNEILITWKAISSAAGYRVYRSSSAKGTYAEIKKTSSTNYTDTKLKENTTYYYKICYYKTVSGVSFNSDYSSVKECKTANNQVGSPFIRVEDVGLLTFDASAGTYRLRLQSNVNWYTSISESWISVSYQSGGSGIYDMDISVQKNTNQSARTGKIQYIGDGGALWVIEIKQSGEVPPPVPTVNMTISGQTYPTGTLAQGSPFGLKGIVSSDHILTSVTAGVYYQSNGSKTNQVKTVYPNDYSCDIRATIDASIIFNDLAPGDYIYKVMATSNEITSTLLSSNFSVASYPFSFPVPGYIFGSCGLYCNCSVHNGKHNGVDISTGGNRPAIIAVHTGVVTIVSQCPNDYGKNSNCGCGCLGRGNCIRIDGNGYSTVYMHMSSISVSNGQSVSRGQEVGKVGTTGWSTGPHLHLELRINGVLKDPKVYIK